jgi:dCTP deaminase
VKVPVSPFDLSYDFAVLLRDHSERVAIPAEGYVMRAGSFVLGWTVERIWLPHRSRLAARVEGKSSLARLGIGFHVTAPTIHAGFGYKKGDDAYPGTPLQLEIWNGGPLDVKLEAERPVCQLIFELVDGTPEKGYEGRFSIQGPSVPVAG